ncbi:MAG: hypothetical protein GY745_18660 [Actinomycetia bacterium]|nr:hypothetical protein [Actinomycetes bacterium]
MATKAEIKAKIQSIFTLNTGLTDWDEVEECLIDEVDSILENIYPTPVNEVSSATHVITTPNSAFSYDVTFTKVGRLIHVIGSFTSNIAFGGSSPIMAIDDSEYDTTITDVSDRKEFGLGYNLSNGNVMMLYASADTIRMYGTVAIGETYYFSITYNALN